MSPTASHGESAIEAHPGLLACQGQEFKQPHILVILHGLWAQRDLGRLPVGLSPSGGRESR